MSDQYSAPIDIVAIQKDPRTYCESISLACLQNALDHFNSAYKQGLAEVDNNTFDTCALVLQRRKAAFNIEALSRDPLEYCNSLSEADLRDLRWLLKRRFNAHQPLVTDPVFDQVTLCLAMRVFTTIDTFSHCLVHMPDTF